MKTSNKTLALLWSALALMLLMTACQQESSIVKQTKSYIQAQDAVGVYSSSRALYLYNENEHQLSFRPAEKSCLFQTDDQRTYLEMALSDDPVEKKKMSLYISAKGYSGLDKEYKVEVLSVDKENHLVRLFNQVSLTGFLMYYEW